MFLTLLRRRIDVAPATPPSLFYSYVAAARRTSYALGGRLTTFRVGPRQTTAYASARATIHVVVARRTSHTVGARLTSITVPAKGAPMASIPTFTKDPDDVLSFTVNWLTWLGSDTISTSAWTVPSGITQSGSATSTTTTATIKLSGGTAGETYTLTNRITTSTGETKDQTLRILVETQ